MNLPPSIPSRIAVVGIGADGWSGLTRAAREAIRDADEIIGSERQLALLPAEVIAAVRTRALPSALEPLLEELAADTTTSTTVLSGGDPMLHGIGATLARRLGPTRLDILPQPSSFALACARLGWPEAEVELISTVARAPQIVARALSPGRKLVVYATGEDGASKVARVLSRRGFGPSRFVVLEQLGGPKERIVEASAGAWGGRWADPLHVLAIECRSVPGTQLLQRSPGLPDDAYAGDDQLTARHIRAMTLAALQPAPGQLLWDVGAASGSIGIEWLRAEPTARAIAIEARADRAQQAVANALRLGVPELEVRTGRAPAALAALDAPDAVFVGGGLTTPRLVESCWNALSPGGRIVANAVTLEGERALLAARAEHGGELTRIELAHAEALGAFTSWRPQLPVVQWVAGKP